MVGNWNVDLLHSRQLTSFCRLNTKLEANDIPPMSSLVKDLSDGVRLIQLMVSNLIFCESRPNRFYVGIFRKSWVLSTYLLWTQALQANYRRRIGGISLGRYNKNPRMRVQKAENVNMALEFITSRGVKLTNIGPEGTLPYPFHDSVQRTQQTRLSC